MEFGTKRNIPESFSNSLMEDDLLRISLELPVDSDEETDGGSEEECYERLGDIYLRIGENLRQAYTRKQKELIAMKRKYRALEKKYKEAVSPLSQALPPQDASAESVALAVSALRLASALSTRQVDLLSDLDVEENYRAMSNTISFPVLKLKDRTLNCGSCKKKIVEKEIVNYISCCQSFVHPSCLLKERQTYLLKISFTELESQSFADIHMAKDSIVQATNNILEDACFICDTAGLSTHTLTACLVSK